MTMFSANLRPNMDPSLKKIGFMSGKRIGYERIRILKTQIESKVCTCVQCCRAKLI